MRKAKGISPTSAELKEYMVITAYQMGFRTIASIVKKTGLTRYIVKKILTHNNVVIKNQRKAIGYIVNILNKGTNESFRKKFYSENALILYIKKFEKLSDTAIRYRIRKALDENRQVIFTSNKLDIRFIENIDSKTVEDYWEKKRAEFNPYKK